MLEFFWCVKRPNFESNINVKPDYSSTHFLCKLTPRICQMNEKRKKERKKDRQTDRNKESKK